MMMRNFERFIIEFPQQEGYATQGAADGHAALSCLQLEPFDIVLLDIHMHLLDGWEVARMIHERGLAKDRGAHGRP